MQQVKVSVTQELIDKNRHRCNDCPVFDAMTAATVPVAYVASAFWIDRQNDSHQFPGFVSDWIRNYDAYYTHGTGEPAKPFEFTVQF